MLVTNILLSLGFVFVIINDELKETTKSQIIVWIDEIFYGALFAISFTFYVIGVVKINKFI